MKKLIIILDPAHGSDVAGKRSPDGLHREYKWSREICADLKILFEALGYEVYYTNHLETEIGLSERRKRAEDIKTDKTKVLLSIHNNAAGDGSKWLNARGFEIWTRKGFDKADILAELIFQAAKEWFPEIKHRYASDSDYNRDKEGNLYMTNSDKYLGLLLEWGFQDNKQDFEILQNKKYNKALADCIVDAVEAFNQTL